MTVRRFLLAYLGVVVTVGATGAVSIHAIKQRHMAAITPAAPQVALADVPESAPPPPVATPAPAALPVPPLLPHQPAAPRLRAHVNKPAPKSFASHVPAQRSYPPPPYYGPGPGPYAAAWPPGTPPLPHRMQPYPYYPYPYYGGYYPRPYYPTF